MEGADELGVQARRLGQGHGDAVVEVGGVGQRVPLHVGQRDLGQEAHDHLLDVLLLMQLDAAVGEVLDLDKIHL